MTQQYLMDEMHLWLQFFYILIDKIIKETQSMINYSEFQLHSIFTSPPTFPQRLLSEISQFDHIDPTIHTNSSINYDQIEQIDNGFDQVEQSKNIFGNVDHQVDCLGVEQESKDLQDHELSQIFKQKQRQLRRMKNQTKNIPKNFGKGIISFIEKNDKKIKVLLQGQKISIGQFMSVMRAQKKSINTIADLRRLWTHDRYGKAMRVISNLFFRKHAMDYIFNSRISNYSSHIKYRQSIWQAIKNPHQFNHIKQY